MVFILILTVTLWGGYYCSYLTGKKTDVQRGKLGKLTHLVRKWWVWNSNPGLNYHTNKGLYPGTYAHLPPCSHSHAQSHRCALTHILHTHYSIRLLPILMVIDLPTPPRSLFLSWVPEAPTLSSFRIHQPSKPNGMTPHVVSICATETQQVISEVL